MDKMLSFTDFFIDRQSFERVQTTVPNTKFCICSNYSSESKCIYCTKHLVSEKYGKAFYTKIRQELQFYFEPTITH